LFGEITGYATETFSLMCSKSYASHSMTADCSWRPVLKRKIFERLLLSFTWTDLRTQCSQEHFSYFICRQTGRAPFCGTVGFELNWTIQNSSTQASLQSPLPLVK